MRNYYLMFMVAVLAIGCKENEPIEKKTIAKISIDTILFKEKKKDDTTILRFSIANIGTEPLKILNSSASCGCTSVRYDTGYILPSTRANVQLVYTHTGVKMGSVLKNVVIETNTIPQFNIVYLKEEAN